MQLNRSGWLVVAGLLLCLGIYLPGLRGGFLFDDFGGLVLNEGLRMDAFSWEALRRGAWSYAQSGPLGRPVAMATFTLDYFFHRLDPFLLKAENLAIHLLNGGLVWVLTRNVVRRLSDAPPSNTSSADAFALFVTLWWLLNPMAMTSVLYVVQRMTSLSATFTLLGLIAYLSLRLRGIADGRGIWLALALAALGVATALAMYTKESGALTLGYAWLLEMVVISRSTATSSLEKIWRRACLLMPLITVAVLAVYLIQDPGWLERRVPGRDYSPWQRQLTEFRVLAFYQRQILFPNIGLFGLYHDDFVLSQSWLEPLTTLVAAMLHVVLILGALLSVRRVPVFTLGILWFYMGHLLESTVFPLEVVHEHRNYLAMWGLLLAASAVLLRLSAALPGVRRLGALSILAVFALVALARADGMGGGLDYMLSEVRHHPHSARANYDAATALFSAVRDGKLGMEEYGPVISGHLDTALAADPNALAPYLGKLSLAIGQQRRPTEELQAFERRLREGVPPAALYMVVSSLMELVEMGSPYFSPNDLQRLFVAALDNPELAGISRAAVLGNYAQLLAVFGRDLNAGTTMMAKALEIAPSTTELRLLYVGMLLDGDQPAEAVKQLELAQRNDRYGYHSQKIEELRRVIASRDHADY